jgi:3-hydroxyisobutyrate dehydrogenase-like beta-hydroxyacid dehydrogenase
MTTRKPEKCCIGLAGLGDMGYPMARRLMEAGYDVIGHDVRPAEDFPLLGKRFVADAGDFAERADIVFSVVRDAAQTDDLLFGRQGIATRKGGPDLLVVCSTLSPRYVLALKDRLPGRIELVDAPMSGGPYSAEEGILTFMLGGDGDTVFALDPLFRVMGQTIHHLGATGSGMTCKVLNNFVCAASVVAVRRAGLLAPELGLDPAKLREVMSSSSGASWFGNNFDRIKFAREGYDPANTMGIIRKDVGAFLDAVSGGDESLLQDFELAVARGIETLPPEPEDDA